MVFAKCSLQQIYGGATSSIHEPIWREQTWKPHPNVIPTLSPHEKFQRGEIITDADRPVLVSWGAVLAGFVFVIAISWLLYLLGLAIGVSIADVTDGEAIGSGMTTGVIVWVLISAGVAYFVGSMFAARLSGKLDCTVGMLHGMAVWALATTATLVLSYMGISSLLQTGYAITESAATMVSSATTSTASGLYSAGEMVANSADSQLTDNIQARLKRRASSVVSKLAAEGGSNVSKVEVRQSIEALSAGDLKEISEKIVMGEMTAARETLADKTKLSEAEVRNIVNGIENEFEQQLGTADNDTGLAGDISNSLKNQAADYVAALDERNGIEVSQNDIRAAFDQLSPQTMQTVAMRLVRGDVQAAKDSLTANTNLSNRQVNDIVDGVYQDVSRTVDRYQTQANEAAAAATDYAQGVLWTVFTASAIGLAISILGGWAGTEGSRRVHFEVRERV